MKKKILKYLKATRYASTPKLLILKSVLFIIILSFANAASGQTITETFTTNGTFTVPPDVTEIIVECWGGGGAGGGGTDDGLDNAGAGGGAGGAYARSVLTVNPGEIYTVTVAQSSNGDEGDGEDGQPSWFGDINTVYAEGGEGGSAVAYDGDGPGGQGSSANSRGDVVYAGGNGANGTDANGGGGGGGGAGSSGNGGNATNRNAGIGSPIDGGDGGNGAPTTEGNGNQGSNYGGGGGGAFCDDGSNHEGGDGGEGLVRITWAGRSYTTSGTFTVPSGVTSITVQCWGAGGTGGGNPTNNDGGGGGGGGAYSSSTLAVTPGTSYTFTVGTGLVGSTGNGGNGGDTWFGNVSTVLAKGGNGGFSPVGGNGGVGGAGGIASSGVGTIKYSGGDGGAGRNNNTGQGGPGGSSAGYESNGSSGDNPWTTRFADPAPNGAGIGGNGGSSGNNGSSGSIPGGGGGGAGDGNRAGGAGANGQVIITWEPPFQALFTAMDIGSTSWYAGETRTVSVTVTNTGTATWTNASPDINIGVKWNADPDYLVRVDANDLAPGESRTYNLDVTAPAGTGLNNLTFDVVNEADCWFGNNNGSCGPGNSVYISPDLTISTIYYSQGSGNTNTLANWNTNAGGGGSTPANFTDPYQIFAIQSGHTMTTSSAVWNVTGAYSSIQVQNGGELTETRNITLAATGILQVDDGGTLNHNVNSTNIFTGTELFGAASTINYGYAGAQAIIAADYGNLIISGGNIKTIQDDISILNNLSLNNGNLSLGSGSANLTIADGATITTTGSFDNSHMIVCDGNGNVIRQSSTTAGFVMVYPVGTNGYYTPMEISALSASVSGTGIISLLVDGTLAPGPPPANITDLGRHWIMSSSGLSSINASLSFIYNDADISGGDENIYEPAAFTSTWLTPSGSVNATTNTITVSGTSYLDAQWTAREPIYTFYSYQSGNWNTASTWTTDPSGTLSVNPSVPGADDRVVILNGRTVTTTANGYSVMSTQINEGGILDIGGTTGHNFGDVRGKGWMRLSTGNFPAGTYDDFVSADGGTVEYYNSANFDLNRLTYNNLIFNLSGSAIVATVLGDLIVNGDLTVEQGTFSINNNASTTRLDLTVYGNVLVEANGLIRLGTGNVGTGNNNAHRFIIQGDFTNNGDVRFTNLAAPAYGSANHPNNRVDVVFNNPTSHQNLELNGLSRFYRIEIDKGTDQTFILNIDASDPSYFNLWGRTNLNPSGTPPSIPNPQALGLLAGTVRLGENIVLPSLAEEELYNIDEDAMIWLDGGSLTYSTVANTDDGTALIIYGGLKVSTNSTLNDNSKQGLVSRTTASILIEGGTITTECVRTSYVAGTHRGAFTMSGGELTIRGEDLPNLGGMNVYGAWTLPYPDNTINISGGTINILSPNPIGGGSGSDFSIVIGANPTNINVTGGTINLTIPAARNAYIASTAPFWDLNIISNVTTRSAQPRTYTANATVPTAIPAQPLIVKNDLTLQTTAVLTSGPNNVDIQVGRNFTIPVGTTYTPGTNTTIFNGTEGQIFSNNGTITTGLYNLSIENSSNTSITQDLTVLNNLSVDGGCFLQDMGHDIYVAGQITNSGTHTSQTGGGVFVNGTVNQSIGGLGTGIFGNLVINKTAGTASLTANQTISGNLRLANGLLDINTYNLTLGATTNIYDALYPATTAVFSGTKMIRTAGNMSDGGVTKDYNSTTPFVFPVGTASDYTPATIQFNAAPSTWGSLNIKPVAQFNPFVTSANSLDYYWKITQTGFAGISSVSHTYRYVDSDLVGRGTEANYIPGVYNPFSWTYINDISQVVDASNDIRFNNVNYASGDFTAGEIDAFQPVTVYYSCTSGDWNQLSTWSTISNAGPANASVLPGLNNPVVIGDGSGINHIVTVPAGYDNISIGGLQINSGSELDITTTIGHNFGAIPDSKVTGTGILKISSSSGTATFPGGDFGNFLIAGGGTVEYYNTGTQDFVVPTTKTYYNNLTISPTSGRYISMPNTDLTVFGDYTINGADLSATTRLNTTATRILTVEGDINILSGTLQYYNGTAQTIYVNNDINISSGAEFNVRNGGTGVTNLLYINGNLNNNGTFDLNTSATLFGNVYFTGNENKAISGTGTNDFNILYVDKGTSRNTILDVTANNLTLSYTGGAALVLNNGTFRVSNSSLAFTLSTTTAFTIPTTAALSVNQGTVTIGTTSNDGDLILAGRLEIINNGVVNIGTGNYNNDIEYASGGNPEIIVTGNGRLIVMGQIRRPLTISTGSLNYTQGGTSQVIIYGRQRNVARSMFEVLNSGSSFTMSGGTLIIRNNFNNPLYNDLYLVPETYSVTGGTVRIGSSTAADNTQSNNVCAIPLWNVIIDGSTAKTANQRIYPMTVLNNLTIEGNSDYRANGLDLTIGGTLINNNSNAGTGVSTGGYQPGSLTQITTFNGSVAQLITGVAGNLTNFANLVVNPTTSLTLSANTNIQVNSNLTINSGTLNDGSNSITVIGNIENNAIHTSPSPTGGIMMNGSQVQTISGNGFGEFGNITLYNPLGIEMIDNSVINGQLTFSSGNLYIDDYLLTFGTNATIGGTPNADNMIMLNGVVSDQGVKKLYPAGAADFTFPIGVAGKYTPARYNVTSNGANGTILVRPVNYKHPSTYENPAATNELQYYWYAVSTGFSGLTVDHEYHYDGGDALPDETNYVVGRYTPDIFSWDVPSEGAVNAASDYFSLTGVNYIYGEYTCGVNIAPSPNFQDMPIYYSRNATSGGNWTDPNAWTLNSDGSGGPAPSYPQGNAVVILAGHTITLNSNSQTAYSVNINGTLAVGTTLYHSLGHIRGGGTINLTSTAAGSFIFPAGVYDEFMENTASTIEFYNNSAVPATLPLKPGNDYKPYQNVIFSGSGVKYMSAENMRVLGDLTINDGTLNNTLHNKTLTILGDWTDNSASATGGFVPGTGRVVFNGAAAQTLTVANGATTEQFYHFQINNAAGVTLDGNGQVDVNRNLYLTLGNINTDATNLLSLNYSATSAVVGGGSSSFVNGPLQKRINSGSYFSFPVGNGNGTRYGNIYISNVTAAGDYMAQYYNHNPGDDGFDPLSVVTPIDMVSNNEYWRINGPVATANVRIRWDDQSGLIPADADSRAKLRIVEWNGIAWTNRGNVIIDGGQVSGTIQTNPSVSVNGNHYFTIGVESLPTVTITSGDSSICDDGTSTGISIDLTGSSPWTIRYRINGANETTINNIANSPYTIMVSNALEPLASQGPGEYKFNMSYISDATGSTGIRYFTDTVTITLNESPNPSITGNTTVGYGETGVVYSSGTGNIPGHTYSWAVSAGATIASGQGTYRITVNFPSSYGTAWVQLTETVSSGGCNVTTDQYEVEISDIPNPLVSGSTPVCNNQTVVYRTPLLSGHTYSWSLPDGGGNIIGAGNLDSVVVQWTTAGVYSVRVDETAGTETRDNTLPVTVNPLPPIGYSVSDPSICVGDTATITITAVAAGLSLQLRLESDNSNAGAAVSSGPGGDIDILIDPSISTIYNILVTNEYICSQVIADLANVTVTPLPIPTITGSDTICQGTTVVYTTEAGMSNYVWTVTNEDGTSDHTITAGGGTTNNSITIRWDGYEDHTISVTYTNGSGCTAASPSVLPVWVFKLPEPGPAHHIPNDNVP
ncbi:MAG: hypothetical protein JXB00_00885 [Bacteroidales bacterium]|nr:hypothetical protein [Bacteroidales bacterium]